METAKIHSDRGGLLPIKSPVPLTIQGGELLDQPDENSYLEPMDAGDYVNHTEVGLPEFKPVRTYTYYLNTKMGDVIQLKSRR